MYQKALAMQAWDAAGLSATADPSLAEFLEHVSRAEGDCWAELAAQVRDRLPEHKERLLGPVGETGAQLTRLTLVRLPDPTRDDERALLQRFVANADPHHDAPALRAVRATAGDLALAADREPATTQPEPRAARK